MFHSCNSFFKRGNNLTKWITIMTWSCFAGSRLNYGWYLMTKYDQPMDALLWAVGKIIKFQQRLPHVWIVRWIFLVENSLRSQVMSSQVKSSQIVGARHLRVVGKINGLWKNWFKSKIVDISLKYMYTTTWLQQKQQQRSSHVKPSHHEGLNDQLRTASIIQ